MSVSEKILDRLRKLIEHERSARAIGSLEEAAAFATKIQTMLSEHKLGMSDVEFDEVEADEPIEWLHVGKEDFEFGSRKNWQVRLARTIAESNGCKTVLEGGWRSRYSKLKHYSGNQFWFVGRTSDREICKVLFLYFVKLGAHLQELCQEQERGTQKFLYVHTLQDWEDFCLPAWRKWMKDWKDSWFHGFATALTNRIYEQHAQAKKAAVAAGSNAIVRIAQDLAAVEAELKGKTEKAGTGRQGGFNRDGFNRGKRSGNSVALTPNTFEGAKGRASRLLT